MSMNSSLASDVHNDSLAIDVRDLSKSFNGRAVVDHVDIRVEQGKICGFLGPNGSGKTTTIRMLCGLLTPDTGNGTCLGLDIFKDAAKIKRQVGYMTQKFGLYEDLSIRQNLDFVARLFELEHRKDSVDAALERLGLSTRQHQLAGSLSGGWKQRLSLAACLIHEPRLLLLDEPTAGVDPKARREFWDQIHYLAAQGITVLVSTHYMDEAERCHELVYIAYGKVLARGTENSIIDNSKLKVWTILGNNLGTTLESLKLSPGVLSVAAFGNAVHVAGLDEQAVLEALHKVKEKYPIQFQASRPNLEDIFISLISVAPDNFASSQAANTGK